METIDKEQILYYIERKIETYTILSTHPLPYSSKTTEYYEGKLKSYEEIKCKILDWGDY